MLYLLQDVWDISYASIDASGIGAGIADFLQTSLGKDKISKVVFSANVKSRLGFDFLSAVNSGRFKMYQWDDSEECREFWHQAEKAKFSIRANQQINFYVDERDGHDDFLISAALTIAAAGIFRPPAASTMLSAGIPYQDGDY